MCLSVAGHSVAAVTAHQFAFCKIDDTFIFHSEGFRHRHFGQRGPEQVRAAACPAAVFISLVKLSVRFVYPAAVICFVQSVGTAGCQRQTPGGMASGALDDGARKSVQLFGGKVVIGVCCFYRRGIVQTPSELLTAIP